MQTRLHGTRKPETTAMLSIGMFGDAGHRGCDVLWSPVAGADEIDRLQEELRLMVRAKAVTGAEDNDGRRHRRSLSSMNAREVAKLKQRSFRKIMAGALSGLLQRPSFRETVSEASVSEIVWSLLHKNTHPGKPVLPAPMINGDPTIKRPQKVIQRSRDTAEREEQEGSRWIKTDSECKFMSISPSDRK
uniref:Uncharacterized protein n=1 Tax=Leersia perrieri TaxID=77586 RepID=A0A0D9VQ99_9ORYZ